MDHLAQELDDAVTRWDELGLPRPDALVVAGSGLSTALGARSHGPIPWSELMPFPVRGIVGHPLEIELLSPVPGRTVLYSRGRLHAYQGYTPAQLVFPARLSALLGARMMLMTNSSGGLDRDLSAGDLMLVSDHINLSGQNPLYGVFPEAWGPQFPDMTAAYDPRFRQLATEVARDIDIALAEGVYVSVAGPSYETPAEVAMLRQAGAHAVGMSTVQEVIAAHHMGMRCGVVSVIANPAAGVSEVPLDHEDVLAVGAAAGERVSRLFGALLAHPDLL